MKCLGLVLIVVGALLIPCALNAQPVFVFDHPSVAAWQGGTVHVGGTLRNDTPYRAEFGGSSIFFPYDGFTFVNYINPQLRGGILDPFEAIHGNPFDVFVDEAVPVGHYEGYFRIVGRWGLFDFAFGPYEYRADFSIDVLPAPRMNVNVISKSRNPSTGNIKLTVVVRRTGEEPVFGVAIPILKLGNSSVLSPAGMIFLGELTAGHSATIPAAFAGSVGPHGTKCDLNITGFYHSQDGLMTGVFTDTVKVVLP